MERLECKRLSQLADTVVGRPNVPKPKFIEIPVQYATDRLADAQQLKAPKKDLAKYFLGMLDPDFKDFSFGDVKVTTLTQRKKAELNLPSSWRLVPQPDPERFLCFAILSLQIVRVLSSC